LPGETEDGGKCGRQENKSALSRTRCSCDVKKSKFNSLNDLFSPTTVTQRCYLSRKLFVYLVSVNTDNFHIVKRIFPSFVYRNRCFAFLFVLRCSSTSSSVLKVRKPRLCFEAGRCLSFKYAAECFQNCP
jgi:hypothetical protein